MAAIIVDGKEIASRVRQDAAERCAILKENKLIPCLAVVLVGKILPVFPM
ncbi:hypothetical protein MASR2M78_04060 [Treponema sp.]